MNDNSCTDQRSRNMAAIRSASTEPELLLRHALWRQGFRYRVNDKRLPGSPDIVLPKYRTAVFVHGCFWHGHKGCGKFVIPKTNTEFWIKKIARNQERDQDVWRKLEAKGWSVVIVWECELENKRFDATLERVKQELINNRAAFLRYKEERSINRLQRISERKDQKNRHYFLLGELAVEQDNHQSH